MPTGYRRSWGKPPHVLKFWVAGGEVEAYAPNTEAAGSSQILVSFYHNARRHTRADGNVHILSCESLWFPSLCSPSCIIYKLLSVELSLKMHPNETPRLFYCRPLQAPSRPTIPHSVSSQWRVPVNRQERTLLNVRECSVSSQSLRRWLKFVINGSFL
jgi:hypothetical protein